MQTLSATTSASGGVPAAGSKRAIQRIKDENAGKLAKVKAFAQRAKLNGKAGMNSAIGVVEVDGFAFLAAMVEGYFGSEKIKIFNVPAHAGLGLAFVLWGLYETFNGSGGQHFVNIGTGLTAPTVVGWGQQAGRKLAESKPAGKSSSGEERKITMTEPSAPAQGTRRVRRD